MARLPCVELATVGVTLVAVGVGLAVRRLVEGATRVGRVNGDLLRTLTAASFCLSRFPLSSCPSASRSLSMDEKILIQVGLSSSPVFAIPVRSAGRVLFVAVSLVVAVPAVLTTVSPFFMGASQDWFRFKFLLSICSADVTLKDCRTLVSSSTSSACFPWTSSVSTVPWATG